MFVSFWFHPKMFNCTVPGCLCSHLCCYPWQVSQVLKPEWFPCLLMFEIWVSFICLLQLIKLNSHVCILHIPGIKKYHKNKQSCTDLFHQHTAFTYLLEPTTPTIPPVQRTWKEFLPSLDQGGIDSNQERERERKQQDWHQKEQPGWLHWHVNSDRFDVQLPYR